jgi:hypothetical protein
MNKAQLRDMTRPAVRFGGDRVHLSTYIPAEVYKVFEKACIRLGHSQAGAIRAALGDWLIKQAEEAQKAKDAKA